jgi:predicted transcriptional regulator YdeE
MATTESFTVIGIKTRTSNKDEMSGAGKIGALWGKFYAENIPGKIPTKLNGEVLSVYHDYESDSSGLYSVMLGLKVAPGTAAPEGFEVLQIPAQKYQVFTCAQGPMPDVVVQGWQKVWSLEKSQEIQRKYSYDLEVYPEGAGEVKILIAVK